VIREDPAHKDLLYVGTDMGVFVSLNGGLSWEALQGGLPHTPVHDLVIQPRENEMVIATHARSVWALPLKYVDDLTPELRKTDLKLFEVDDITHLSSWGYDRKSRWDTSPPKAPVVKVAIYTSTAGKGTIRIKDKTGKVVKEKSFDVVNGYNFTDFDIELSPAKPGLPPARTIKTVQDVLADPYLASRPVYLAPGDYTLEVKVGAKSVTQPWKIRD
jgi:hypothetical protein